MLATIIVVEGADKMGKQTQTKMIAESLKLFGHKVSLVEVPVNDNFTHKVIYWMLRNGLARRFSNLFQFVQFMNKFIFQFTGLLKLRLTNDFVVLDRWSLSSIVYGDATGTNKIFNRILYSLLVRPKVTVILHGPSFSRSTIDDVYEKDSKLQNDVKKRYYDWANSHPSRHELIDNQGTKEIVHGRVLFSIMKNFV
jgi:thymidylate kinase